MSARSFPFRWRISSGQALCECHASVDLDILEDLLEAIFRQGPAVEFLPHGKVGCNGPLTVAVSKFHPHCPDIIPGGIDKPVLDLSDNNPEALHVIHPPYL
jgi:hypothetical protein